MSRQTCSQYIAEVEKIIQYGGSRKETSIRFAFQKLLDEVIALIGKVARVSEATVAIVVELEK